MTRDEVLSCLCEITTEVSKEVFNYSVASDCFCSDPHGNNYKDFKFEMPVIDFIKKAVWEQIKKENGWDADAK